MNLNYKAIINVMGTMLLIVSATFIPPIIVSIIYKEVSCILAFCYTAIPCMLVGVAIKYSPFISSGTIRIRESFFIVSMTWILFPCIGAVPFVISGDIPSYVDAVFESCSGFSTTGATILTDIESLSKGMLFWRSFTHWLGGMGVLILAIAVFAKLNSGKQNIAKLESTGPTLGKISPKMSDSARQLYILYVSFTIAEMILLCLGGMSLYDSAVQTFGTIGTGGFSNYNNSIAHFDSVYIEVVIMVFMFACGVSFNLYFNVYKNGIKVLLKDGEFKLYTFIVLLFIVVIAISLLASGESIGHSIRNSSFQVISIITTTGFGTDNYDLWPALAKYMLFLLFFVGGSTSSTAGGVKVLRILILLKLLKRNFSSRLHPKAVIQLKISGQKISSDVVSNVTSYFFLYIFMIIIGTLLVSIDNFDFTTTFSAVCASIGNVGPGFNLVGPVMNFSVFSGFSKCILSFLMIAGRLELYTFLAFFLPHFWNPDRY